MASIPAIQPVSNRRGLTVSPVVSPALRVHRIYGRHGTPMPPDRDFTAPREPHLHATGDGVDYHASNLNTGGQVARWASIMGMDTLTRYPGTAVRNSSAAGPAGASGKVIGWAGSTGASTGPYCHRKYT